MDMRLKVYVRTNRVGSECEDIITVEPIEVKGMNQEARELYFDQLTLEHVQNTCEWGWQILED